MASDCFSLPFGQFNEWPFYDSSGGVSQAKLDAVVLRISSPNIERQIPPVSVLLFAFPASPDAPEVSHLYAMPSFLADFECKADDLPVYHFHSNFRDLFL